MNYNAKVATIRLLKGILYKKDYEKPFYELIHNSYNVISEYFANIGLEVMIHEEDGFAYLQNIIIDDSEESLPKLIPARVLGYKTSLLSVLLRQKIAEFEMQNEDERAIITKDDIVSMLLLFLENRFDEVKLSKEIDTTIKKVVELGFLKTLKTDELSYEIKPSIKAFVDAEWLDDFDNQLKLYKNGGLWS